MVIRYFVCGWYDYFQKYVVQNKNVFVKDFIYLTFYILRVGCLQVFQFLGSWVSLKLEIDMSIISLFLKVSWYIEIIVVKKIICMFVKFQKE